MGIDELDWCALVAPGITTLAQPTDTIGKTAVHCLMHRITPTKVAMPKQLSFPPTLMARGSTPALIFLQYKSITAITN